MSKIEIEYIDIKKITIIPTFLSFSNKKPVEIKKLGNKNIFINIDIYT